ncbi:hypothetical protein WB44_02870 [Synechococcus sp. WH 8020]|uniref:hypothetical protein n=1 Tax=Synechococcus sp. (strain WH8020) TaxID=32052 RepID=UPI00065280AC|nr:hypothetical protein [Synechococcus sp. WH 8020]AKN60236.1 hypothetical protein WB44_02870 [Synechococcus sp. WH 8020]
MDFDLASIAQSNHHPLPRHERGFVSARNALRACPQPSTLNPQPSTLNPQPSTLNTQMMLALLQELLMGGT